jgi:hypothetical protein
MEPELVARSFARFSGTPMTINARNEITLWQVMWTTLGGFDARGLGLRRLDPERAALV